MTNLVGQILGKDYGDEHNERVMAELEAFMFKYGLDRIDIGWKVPDKCQRCGEHLVMGTPNELFEEEPTSEGVDPTADLGRPRGITDLLEMDEPTGEPLSDQNATIIGTADGPIGKRVADLAAGNENAGEEQLPLASGVERNEALGILDNVTTKMDAMDDEAPKVLLEKPPRLSMQEGGEDGDGYPDPENMHGAADGFGGSDFEE